MARLLCSFSPFEVYGKLWELERRYCPGCNDVFPIEEFETADGEIAEYCCACRMGEGPGEWFDAALQDDWDGYQFEPLW